MNEVPLMLIIFFRWERYLPKSGTDFQSAIQHLRSKGIAEESRKYDAFVKELIHFQIRRKRCEHFTPTAADCHSNF